MRRVARAFPDKQGKDNQQQVHIHLLSDVGANVRGGHYGGAMPSGMVWSKPVTDRLSRTESFTHHTPPPFL